MSQIPGNIVLCGPRSHNLQPSRNFDQEIWCECQEGVSCLFDLHLELTLGALAAAHAKTTDGFEAHMGTNHLGPFLLTMLLLPCMQRTARTVRPISPQ